jgi:tetratricopeptide (TPR) repeat protein
VIGDGEVSGVVTPNWNWRFARLLIDQMKPFGPDDGFVSAWYHGTASFLLRRRDFSEGTDHLDHAVQVLPNDARILFDRGTVYESLAMNLFQQASLGSVSRPAVTLAQGIVIHPSDTSVTLPDPAVINTRARRLYERAVAINPGLIEAHVRLAREMELSGEFAAASREVTAALKLDPATDLAFYAHLFGARAANALGHDAEAETHVTAALALYPDADSAWLAASQTALRRADPGTALERLGRLEAVTRTVVDPWLVYPLGAGRLAELALTELWGFKPATAPQ